MDQHQQQQQQQQGLQTNMIVYNFNNADGILATAANPVQVEFGSADIARQINQQVQMQYANLQGSLSSDQTQQIVITHQPTYDTTDDIDPAFIKTPKTKMRSPGQRVMCTAAGCDKTFSCNANLRDHMRLHTGEKPFKCTECAMSFAQRSNWRLHKRVHTGERPYMCGICGKTFSRSSHLPGHIRVHTGERPFNCSLCDHTFSSSQALKNHARTHTGEKPFVCPNCTTAFTHSSSLSSHKKRCTGVKQKRGRPAGTTWKKRKGKARGRPKKRSYRLRNRKGEDEDPEIKQEATSDLLENEDDCDMLIDPEPESLDFAATQGVLNSSEIVEISVEVLNAAVDRSEANQFTVKAEDDVYVNGFGATSERVELTDDMVRAAATAAGLTDSSDLHQEAAVTMTTLHHGVVNLAHQGDDLQQVQPHQLQ